MDALKERVGAFTEGILIMSCPVLAAVVLKKVDLSSEGNAAVRGSISPLAAVSLFLSSLAFILLGIASALKGWLPFKFSHPIELAFRFTKLLVHLCAIAQMLLAYMILLLISMRSEAFVALLTVSGPFVFCCGYLSVIRIQERIDRGSSNSSSSSSSSSSAVVNVHRSFDNELKPSLEFSAAMTSLLFLGLEGLALEGQTGVGQDLDPSLLAPIRVTFFFCVMASTVMLFAAVPPIDYDKQEHRKFVCTALHVSCGALTLFFAAPVLTIVFVLEREKGVTAAFVPYLTLLLFYVVCLCIPGGKEEIDKNEVTPPASMEMTKVTFTGFLAVTLPKFRDGSLSRHTHAFVISTAMAVLFGLAWRFLSHFKQRAAVWTAKVACLLTYVCLGVAVFPFMSMAMQALADADSECHIPCNSTRPYLEQLDSFIACFNRNAIKTSSYALSSVKC